MNRAERRGAHITYRVSVFSCGYGTSFSGASPCESVKRVLSYGICLLTWSRLLVSITCLRIIARWGQRIVKPLACSCSFTSPLTWARSVLFRCNLCRTSFPCILIGFLEDYSSHPLEARGFQTSLVKPNEQ